MRLLRRALRRSPRCLLGVLLAFAIEILQPAVSPTWHRHAGGDRPHVHLGPLVLVRDGAARSVAVGGDRAGTERRDGKPTIGAAGRSGLHAHLSHPLQLGETDVAVPARPAARVTSAGAPRRDDPAARGNRVSQARAPPSALV